MLLFAVSFQFYTSYNVFMRCSFIASNFANGIMEIMEKNIGVKAFISCQKNITIHFALDQRNVVRSRKIITFEKNLKVQKIALNH